ncbi:Pannexin-2 [Varanus komodoensis]|nr:Pannexin-2 [Varanus komodoensis]
MVLQKPVPSVHIFSTRAGDVIVRPDLSSFLLLPSLPTSPEAQLFPLHASLREGEHYFGSRWLDSVYIIKGNKLLEAQDLSSSPRGPARPLHPSCCGGQHYFVTPWGTIGVILSPGTMTAMKDLTTGEPDPIMDLGQHPWSKEKMESHRSYLYWQLQDNFSGEFFSFHPNVLSFLPGGLGILRGPAFGAWELLSTFHNYSHTRATKTQGIFRKVGCAKEKLADIGQSWVASPSDFPKSGSIAVVITQAQFALPTEYGGLGLSTEQEEWGEAHEKEETLQFTLEPDEAAYVWQYRLGLGKEDILFCRAIKVTCSCDPPSEIPLPSSSEILIQRSSGSLLLPSPGQ